MESEAEPSSKELLKIYDTTLAEKLMQKLLPMIENCANQWKTSPSKVYQALKQSGCLDNYLIPYYDILHTQSTDYIVADVATYLKEREVAV